MLRTLQRRVNLTNLLQATTASRTVLSTNPTRGYVSLTRFQQQPLLTCNRFQQRQQALFQHGFHTITPLFDEQKKPALPESEEEVIDPNHKMLIGFTCKVCQDRSHHVMSKHSYTKGVVLIQCPGCKNRHLIADNLGWFRDSKTTVEDLVKEKGEAIRRVFVDNQGVERLGDLMEWLPDIAEEEKVKKAEAKKKAEELKLSQKKEEE